MDTEFLNHIETFRSRLKVMLATPPFVLMKLPKALPKRGIYVLSEEEKFLYVGRSNFMRKRIRKHCRPSASHRMAAFAFRLAREKTKNPKASYVKGPTSRAGLATNPAFLTAFQDAKKRIKSMDVRVIEEADPICQALLEIYVSVVLKTPYNDFDNH